MRVVILSALLVLFNLGWIEAQITKSGNKSPNIIIILADDLGFDDVSFRGAREFLTPNIDALAYHGRILDRLYAPSICTPSRAALLSGKYPIHTGTQHFVISNDEPWALNINTTLMPEIFRNAGYSTNLVGKWHLGFSRPKYTPTRRGFDYHFGYWGGFIDYYSRRSKWAWANFSNGYDFRRNMELECADLGTYVTDLLTNEAERLIRDQATKEKPLFLMLSHLAPHTANPKEYLQAPEDEISKFKHISDPDHRKYAAMVSRLDQSVGRVISALESTNQLENSIVIFSSDNGSPTAGLFANTGSNWPLKGQKNTPWEGGVRVAAAIWSPLLQARGSLFTQPMYVGDFLPTLAHAAGLQLPESLQLDGIDLWPQLSGPKDARLVHREILHNLDDIWQVSSFMSGNWKYVNGTTLAGRFDYMLRYRELDMLDPRKPNYFNEVLNSPASKAMSSYDLKPLTHNQVKRLNRAAAVRCGDQQRGCNALLEECLYNLSDDPCETNNLVYSEAHAQVLRELRERVQQLRAGALEPGNRHGVIHANPSFHKCTWQCFEAYPPESERLECHTNEEPCGS